MRTNLFPVLVSVIALGLVAAAARNCAANDDEQETVRIQKILANTLLQTMDLPGEMSLTEFLAALEARLPAGKKISLRIDEEGFGKQAPRVAGAVVKPLRGRNVSLATVLSGALAQVAAVEEADYAIRPPNVVITRPRLAGHRRVYDAADIVRQMPLLLPDLKNQAAELYQDVKPTQGAELLVRFLANGVDLRPWETIQVLNSTHLDVLASPARHEEIAHLLGALRRLADVAVVMNARLYETDRAFLARHVTPLFAGDKNTGERPRVVAIDGPLFKRITGEKLLLESEEIRVRPNEEASFLSRRTVFRYAARPGADKQDRPLTGTGLAGVSFEVRPVVSPDRRYIRLRIAQRVVQLVGIDKTKTLDGASGKELEAESPNVRKTSVAGTVRIPDGNPILMPVDYRPPGGEDKVWLLVARPFLWIEEEVKRIRREGGDLSPRSVWESDVQNDDPLEPEAPARRLPPNDDVKEVLQAVITDVLTNPDLKSTRDFYGTPKDKTITLVDEGEIGWPPGFRPETPGYHLVEAPRDPFVNGNRVLGVRLEQFELNPKKADPDRAPIRICLFNAGGSANGAVIGGCLVSYVPKRVGKRRTVECVGTLDP